MKKSQIVSFALLLVLAFFMGRMSAVPENQGIVSQDAGGGEVIIGQTTTDDEGGGGDAEGSPSETPSPESSEPEATTPDDAEQTVDLGPDLELDDGITDEREQQAADAAGITVKKGESYTSKVEVALYIHTYGRVPNNYISKTKARDAGWVSNEGNLWDVLPGMSIGGGGFQNEGWGDEPLLPETPEGRNWKECDINYQGGFRGAERLVYSDDGLVFYTGDHYRTFERLY